jgi:ubiquitin-like 1-activating enzyme E1 B
MEDMWKSRKPPTPLNLTEIPNTAQSTTTDESSNLMDQRMWTLEETVQAFMDRFRSGGFFWRSCRSIHLFYYYFSLRKLSATLLREQQSDPNVSLHFDKDDSDSLDFVTATANLRARVFGIEEKSRFQVKGSCFFFLFRG